MEYLEMGRILHLLCVPFPLTAKCRSSWDYFMLLPLKSEILAFQNSLYLALNKYTPLLCTQAWWCLPDVSFDCFKE